MDLHFCCSNRAIALNMHRAFAESTRTRLFPIFHDVEEQAENFADEEYERLGSEPAWDGGPELADLAEAAFDRGIQKYDELLFVKGQVLALATAGMFHLWEKTLKSFLIREIRYHRESLATQKTIERADFDALLIRLEQLGYIPAARGDLKILSLVANTAKHGEGN